MLITILGSIGATIILTQSKLFRWLQNIDSFFKCPMCMGFWVGVIISFDESDLILTFLKGCTISLLSFTWLLLMKYFIERYDS